MYVSAKISEGRIHMTVSEAHNAIKACISPISVCKVAFSYQQYEEFFFPLSLSEELFIGVTERDFVLDGYSVRRLSDVTSVEQIRGTYLKIHHSEGNISRLSLPPISIKSWKTSFHYVYTSSENVIIEGTAPSSDSKYFLIGRVLAVGEQGIRFRSFDGSGTWSEKIITVPYTSISSLTFGSSYITTYSKYVKPYPELTAQKPIKNR